MSDSILQGLSYDTPEDKPRVLADKLLFDSRWYFIFNGYVREGILGGIKAKKGLYDTKQWVDSSRRIFKLIENCGGRFHLKGLDNISALKGPAVFISNHMSVLETFVFPYLIASHQEVTFVIKESLVKIPIFGHLMSSRNPIIVKRVNPREDFQVVMEKGKELLQKGISIIVFPQSTRSVIFDPDLFNSMGVKLAKAAGVPIVPVAIKTDFWGNGKIIKDIGRVNRKEPIHMIFGKSMRISGNGKEEHQKIVDFITENLIKIGHPVKK